jgi:arsenate reductase-like glutaredoxin family protein
MSLSSINVARAFARENNMDLSMANIKTLIHNNMMLQRIIRTSGLRPNKLLNTNNFKELLFYGVADTA